MIQLGLRLFHSIRQSFQKCAGIYGYHTFIVTLVALGMVMARVLVTLSPHYMFFFWNVLLAVIPLYLSAYLLKEGSRLRSWKWLMVAVSWVLFFPNAMYLVTDVVHVLRYDNAPIWYDMAMVLLFAYLGLRLCFLTLFQIQKFMETTGVTPAMRWGGVIGLLYLNALGIYIGRFLRWNSWDILWAPHSVLYDIFDRILSPQDHFNTTAFTLILWGMSLLLYGVWYGIHRGRRTLLPQ